MRNQVLKIAEAIGADAEAVQTSPDFHRFELHRGEDREMADFVFDRIPQLDRRKESFDSIRVDTLREIIANKWATLISRTELKDLIDLFFIERAGHDILKAFPDARRKEAGLEAAVLSHLLDAVRLEAVPDYMIEELNLEDLRSFIDRIRKEMAERAFPESA